MLLRRLTVGLAAMMVLTSCGGNEPAAATMTSGAVVDAFIAAGLPVAGDQSAMAANDYGMAPFLCEGSLFGVTTVEDSPDANGRAFVCKDKADADKLSSFYADLGKTSAILFSHVLRNESAGVVVQLPGDMSQADADRFKATVDTLK